MTNNQREFQRQINRLQREINKLLRDTSFTQGTPLPTQPKRVTHKRIKQLEELNGRHFVISKDDYVKHPRVHGKGEYDYERKGRVHLPTSKSDKYNSSKSKSSTVKTPKDKSSKPQQIVDGYDELPVSRKPRSDKGVKRGSKAKIIPNKQLTMNVPLLEKKRKTRKDKGTHLSDEERLKRNAKRNETLANKNAQYAMTHETPAETEYDMVADIIERLDKAWNTIDEEHDYLFNLRDGYLQELLQLMHDNIDQNEYYLTLKGREEEIQNEIDGVVWGSTQPIVDGSYQTLMSLLTPKDILLPDLKAIAEEGESIKAINHTVEDGYYG